MDTESRKCSQSYALGMQSGHISDEQITSSSFFEGVNISEANGRLNNFGYWGTNENDQTNPWIQVDLLEETSVTGIITQGGAGGTEYVETLQIQFGESEDNLAYIVENGVNKVSDFVMFLIAVSFQNTNIC